MLPLSESGGSFHPIYPTGEEGKTDVQVFFCVQAPNLPFMLGPISSKILDRCLDDKNILGNIYKGTVQLKESLEFIKLPPDLRYFCLEKKSEHNYLFACP